MIRKLNLYALFILLVISSCASHKVTAPAEVKPRVIVTSDGEVDDECSMVRFLLYSNEWNVEGIITSSSQYHWRGHRWAGDDWVDPYLEAYKEVYPNLVKHDKGYPAPDHLKSVSFLGNVDAEGEMDSITPGSQHIVKVLLDKTNEQPVWLQAWGGTNTIARALKTIQEEHPEQMEEVAKKIRFFFIWEQDSTYQAYIQPNWGRYNILTIISDQFWAIAYQWNKILPDDKKKYFEAEWMKPNLLEGHGPLCSLYKAHVPGSHGLSGDTDFESGDFRSEGDSPAFLHTINTGLRNMESPDYGGWGGRYINVRDNIWLDPVPEPGYKFPEGRWYTGSAWGRKYMREEYPENQELMNEYFKPLTRWADAIQNDFAARADWCIKSFEKANHPPTVQLDHPLDLVTKPGSVVALSAESSSDPDGDELTYQWWYYKEAGNYRGEINIENASNKNASVKIPEGVDDGTKIHIVCEVGDNGEPQLTRYQRVIIQVKSHIRAQLLAFPTAEGYGKYSKGGRGGVVYEVTSLNDSGEGSLREAVEAEGPRTIVFRISGNIELKSPITINKPYITIAGQTAPGDGITLKNYPMNIDADHVIIRYIRIRPGDVSGNDYDAVSGRYGKHIILDHISASWSIDEAMSVYHCDSITVQWSVISESMYNSNHAKGTHGYGGIWGSNYSTYHHNLLAHHTSRNPRMASGSGYTDYRNNVVYNWGYNSLYGGEKQQQGNEKFDFSELNIVANYYKPGPATRQGEISYRIANPSSRGEEDFGKWYIAKNFVEGYPEVSKNNWNGGVQTDIPFSKIKLETPWPAMPIIEHTAEEAYKEVLENAGAILPKRDPVDARIIQEVRGGYATFEGETYKKNNSVADPDKPSGIIDSQTDVGGWPHLKTASAPQDSDHDGMPDAWEEKNHLNKNDATDRNSYAADGYTMLEKYLSSIKPD